MTNLVSLDEFELVEAPQTPEAFTVDDDSKADWAMRKLAHLRRKQAENQALAEAEIKRVTEWLQTVNRSLDNDAAYFEAVLTPYALLQRSEGRKSVSLPHGTIKTTGGRPKIEIEDEEKFLAWAKESETSVIRIKTEIDKKALNALIRDDNQVISTQGEIVPAVRVIPAETSVSFVTE
jgi:hypothetical protein